MKWISFLHFARIEIYGTELKEGFFCVRVSGFMNILQYLLKMPLGLIPFDVQVFFLTCFRNQTGRKIMLHVRR